MCVCVCGGLFICFFFKRIHIFLSKEFPAVSFAFFLFFSFLLLCFVCFILFYHNAYVHQFNSPFLKKPLLTDSLFILERYLLADRSVFSIPVAMTLLASFVSPITLLGDPAETYVNGGLYFAVLFSNFLLYPTIALVFVPVFYKLEITSVYEVGLLHVNASTIGRCQGNIPVTQRASCCSYSTVK